MRQRWSKEQPSSKDELLKECISYFKSSQIFDRMLVGFRDKYYSYGAFQGKVQLTWKTPAELEMLEGFLSRSYHGKMSATVSAERFRKAVAGSRFSMLEPEEILKAYFRESDLTTRKNDQAREAADWEDMYGFLVDEYQGTPAENWITDVKNDPAQIGLRQTLMRIYHDEHNRIQMVYGYLKLGARILNALPCYSNQMEYLAVFAAKLTGNPHALDDDTEGGAMLFKVVEWREQRVRAGSQGDSADRNNTEGLFPILDKQRKYLLAGILRDDVSNYVNLSGVRVLKKDGNVHQGMEGFANECEMVQIPLSVISGWKRIECPDDEIYIVENPSVYAMMTSYYRGMRACMCMNGQPRLGTLMALDLLAQSKVTVYYAGDFDPEGIQIAQKLRRYYGGEFHYWYMTVQDYMDSNPIVELSQRRLSILEKLQDDDLSDLIKEVQKKKKAGYQEMIWKKYCSGIFERFLNGSI